MKGTSPLRPSFLLAWLVFLIAAQPATGAEKAIALVDDLALMRSVERALPLLEIASAGSADRRQCFTCHSQAIPVFALVEASRRGFQVDSANLQRQIEHSYAHLKRGVETYKEGKGQGGGIDTAGYALWSIEDGGRAPDEVSDAVIGWMLKAQTADGFWKATSSRPPTQGSRFTSSYLALRALSAFGREKDNEQIHNAKKVASSWMLRTAATDHEDLVFQILSSLYTDMASDRIEGLIADLMKSQRQDGGWAQKAVMESDAYATGTALYALNRTGTAISDPVWKRGIEYLVKTQHENGSWHVVTRSNPIQTYYETGFPHAKDQFISSYATAWATICLLYSLPEQPVKTIASLPGTRPLEMPESDLSGRLMIGAHRFVDSEIDRANGARHKLPLSTDESREQARTALREILGVIEQRAAPRMERYGDDDNPALVASTKQFDVYQVRWPVFDNVHGEGLLVLQREASRGMCIVVPDADQTPELLLGLVGNLEADKQIASILARNGFDLLIPAIVGRDPLNTEDSKRKRADMTHREWIYRQAFHMGRQVVGYDIQRVLGAVDWFASRKLPTKIGIVGYGEGGFIAMMAAGVDPRIEATWVSGYFDSSDAAWAEPIYRNLWRRSQMHGNAEVASLIAPRALVIEHCQFPKVTGHKGDIRTPEFEHVKAEFELIRKQGTGHVPQLIAGEKGTTIGPWSRPALQSFAESFGINVKAAEPTGAEPTGANNPTWIDGRRQAAKAIAERQSRCVSELETHVQTLVRNSEHVRDSAYLYQVMPEFAKRGWSTERRHPISSSEAFIAGNKDFRKRFQREAMGQFDRELLPPNARTREIAKTDKWTAYDVVLDVHEHLMAWGVLVVPHGMAPGEKRPVVVCQHGRNGVPRDTLDTNNPAYNNFAATLAERGFITFAPHNLYRGEDQYRWLDRKANALGCSLFSFIIASHDQVLRWLDTLPFVDGGRIAFYGLSYGGETAVRVPTVLEKYCLSICSGDFNQWTHKVASTDQPFSFMNTIEWEMPYWNLGHTFDYAEMTYLMLPRPFMVERGHNDGVGKDQWVAHEFAKVHWLYAQFGLSHLTEIEYFQGGHSINGVGSFDFLHRHLRWPVPKP
ncbi:MAG: dienelactone hydrolase family protein [Pirellula sp.]